MSFGASAHSEPAGTFDKTRSRPKASHVRLGTAAAVIVLASPALAAAATPDPDTEQTDEQGDSFDPRKRKYPRTHRFRMGVQIDYVRLTQAIDQNTGETTRFHFAPLQLDFAYQAQFLKFMMVRPSFAIGGNVANTAESMPLILHPQLYTGYQGPLFGAALGYGYIGVPIVSKDALSDIRGGPPRPIITGNHHLGVELSLTTRVHKRSKSSPGAGQLSVILRLGAIRSHLQHLATDTKG